MKSEAELKSESPESSLRNRAAETSIYFNRTRQWHCRRRTLQRTPRAAIGTAIGTVLDTAIGTVLGTAGNRTPRHTRSFSLIDSPLLH